MDEYERPVHRRSRPLLEIAGVVLMVTLLVAGLAVVLWLSWVP